MHQKAELLLSLSQLEQLYINELPDIVSLATHSKDGTEFKVLLMEFLRMSMGLDRMAVEQFNRFIIFDGKQVDDLSTGKRLLVSTLSMLHAFLNGKWSQEGGTELFLDLFHQLKRLYGTDVSLPSAEEVGRMTERWSCGLDADVLQLRAQNKERIIHVLVQKLTHRGKGPSRYRLEKGLSYEEKYNRVCEWWNDHRFHLAMAVRTPEELNHFLGYSLSSETLYVLEAARKKGIPFFVTPYYLSLLNCSAEGYDDQTLRSYILYSPELVETFGEIHAWEKEDVVEAGKPNAAGWLLPEGHNIHRRYPEVAILIPDTMGRACGGLCASCQRMYDFQSHRLNFNLESLCPNEHWEEKLQRLLKYFEEDTQLRDMLITGGDALMSQNKTLRRILQAVYEMAVRKRDANLKRRDGEKYAELQRVRLGSRLLAYLPMRIDEELVDILREFKAKAMAIGIRQFIIQTHFQTPLEITPEAAEGIRKLLQAGWMIDNQLVYNVAASRRGHTTRLRQELNRLGVICYYTFTVKGFQENAAVFTPNARSVQEQQEEKVWGKLTDVEAKQLTTYLENAKDAAVCLRTFLAARRLSFLATDRNVLNLPAIGKSMTFTMVGITAEGKRILCFEHDGTRRHSPIINKIGKVFIVENKSIAAYLGQLDRMGENIDEYASIWKYTEGKTEPRFNLYEYPDFAFNITPLMTNLDVDSEG